KKTADVWSTTKSEGGKIVQVSGDEPIVHPLLEGAYDAWLRQGDFSYLLKGKDLNEYYKGLTRTNFKLPDSESKISEEEGLQQFYYVTAFPTGNLYAFRETEFPEEAKLVMKRFAEVINITYTRFLDLQKAEAQAREAKIEMCLERVRARTMAMHQSSELAETASVLFKQLMELGIKPNRLYIAIVKDESGVAEFWITDEDGSKVSSGFSAKMNDNPTFNKMFEGWHKKNKSLTIDMQGKELQEYFEHLARLNVPFKGGLSQKRRVQHIAFFSQGFIGIASPDLQPEETVNLLERFAAVFNLTYRRFLDLQNAEAQAKESQIQLALERVRARTMAMHKSEELSETSFVLFKQLEELGEVAKQFSIGIFNEEDDVFELYATIYGSQWKETGRFPLTKHPVHKKTYEAWKEQKKSLVIDLSGKELEDFNRFKMENSTQYKSEADLPKNRWVIHNVFFSKGTLIFSTYQPRPPEIIQLLERFAGVFNLTYTRFLDLQKAEAQTREAQIEAALERVRSKAMAMHSSDDLAITVDTFFSELSSLKVTPRRCGVGIIDAESRMVDVRVTSDTQENEIKKISGKLKLSGHPILDSVFEHWKLQKEFHPVLRGNEIMEYYRVMNPQVAFPDFASDETQYGYYFFFKEGWVYAWTNKEVTERDLQIFRRYTSVLSLTHRRYMDLKDAEAQTREAEIEAALERVRSRTMAMHKSEELAEVVAHLFEQLKGLDINTYRCNLGVVDESLAQIQYWATTNEGKVRPVAASIPITLNIHTKKMYDGWKNQENIVVIRLIGEERLAWTESVRKYISFTEYLPENMDRNKILNEPAILSNFYFKQGFFAIHTLEELNSSYQNIINRFTKVFEQTYTRFLDLKKAEAQTREAKIETSLERVRSKAMAMHSPNDLSETVNVFFKELKTLGIIPIRCGVGQIDEETRTTSLTTTTSSQQGDSFQVIGKVKQTGHPVLDGIFDNWKLQKEYHPVLQGEDIKAYYDVMNPQIGYPDYSDGVTQYGNSFPFKEGFVFAWTESKLSEEELQLFRRFTSVLSLTYRRYIDLKEAEVRTFEAIRQASLDRVRAEIASMRTSEDLN
ncbi:MAG: hypothetical protein ACHQLA_06795, partial [Ignavibacteriales bacterium]